MARPPRRERPEVPRRPEQPPRPEQPGGPTSDRDKIIAAFMALLAEKPFDEIGLAELARRAGVSLVQLRDQFASTGAILEAHVKAIDRQVLAAGDAEMEQEPPRERLFDVLMRRIEALTPHKAAVRSLVRSAYRDPSLAFALNGLAVRSQQWMLTAADINATGPRGAIRAQGLAYLYARVLRVWLDDEDPGLARTMAALDRELARGQRWSNFLDDLCRFSPLRFRRRDGWRPRERDEDSEAQPVAM